jgi:hypothetical protein
MVSFAYRGTDKLEFLGDWGLSDLATLQFNNNLQVPIANRFAANTLIDQGNADRAKVYITGHRLGQDLTPYFEKTIDKSAHSLAQFNTIFY